MADGCIRRKSVSVVVGAENGSLRGMNVVALIEFSFEVRQANHDGQIIPDVPFLELESLAHKARGTNSGSRCFSAFDVKYSLPLEAVEVLSKAPSICFEIVALDGERKQGVDFIKRVQEMKEVSRATVCSNGEEVTERGRDERGELLLREQFWDILAKILVDNLWHLMLPKREGL